MKITNHENLPEVLVRAITNNWYSGTGEKRFASVTQLIKPTKMAILEKRYWNEITQDASEMIWSLMGSAMHKVLEAGEGENSLNEERLTAVVKDAKVSGGVDLYEDGIITDFKFTSTYSFSSAGRKAEWEKQLNLYAYLFREQGFEVTGLRVLAIFRDWQRSRKARDANYPRLVEAIEIPLWDADTARRYIAERVEEMQEALLLPDDLIPECTAEERWQGLTKYAVYKQGNTQRALRVFDEEAEAREYLQNHSNSASLELLFREEPPKRCLEYCPVKDFCHFYRSLQESSYQEAA